MPGCVTYILGGVDGVEAGVEKNFCVYDLVDGRSEVRTSRSVRRLEDSYASWARRHWMSEREKKCGRAVMLPTQTIRLSESKRGESQ